MKKLYTILAIAAVAAVGCAKTEVVNDNTLGNKITFQAANYTHQTKAEVSIMSEFTSFKCKAFLHADGYEGETQNLFGAAGETISAYTSADEVTTTPSQVAYWAPSHPYYWPKSTESYVNFVAWYDKGGVNPNTATETNLVWNNYTVKTSDNLLYADEAWHYRENPSAVYKKDGTVTEGVPILFHHALAQLCLKAKVTKASEGNTSWDVTLENIKINGVYNTGNLSLTNSDPSSTTHKEWTGNWTTTGEATTINMDNVTSPLTTAETEVLAMQNVLPQELTASNTLTLDYNISYKYSGSEYAHEKISATIKLSDFTNSITAWAMNKKITYTLIINPETTVIKLDPAMVDWESEDAGTYTL